MQVPGIDPFTPHPLTHAAGDIHEAPVPFRIAIPGAVPYNKIVKLRFIRGVVEGEHEDRVMLLDPLWQGKLSMGGTAQQIARPADARIVGAEDHCLPNDAIS
jgi:hypothetical protein